jgi:glycosyltransferase involved in cell wall biosynthesis
MKVLFFIRSLVVGGSQRQLVMLAEGLRQRGHDVLTAVFYTGGEIEGAAGAMRVAALGKSGRWDAIGPLVRLRRLILDEQPDVIYAFQPTQTVLAALLRPRRPPTRLVFGIRGAGIEARRYDALTALTYRLEALLARRADLVIANSAAGRDDAIARGLPADRIAVVANGIDTDTMRPDAMAGRERRRAWGIAEGAFVIGCVARLDPMKDHPGFLAAAARFAGGAPDARFVCVGDGPAAYRDELADRARSLGIADKVVWAGEVADVKAAYNAFDILTLPSAFGEGFPNVIGEAMACGVPVAATDVGDARAIVGALGEVVPPKQPELLSAAWARLRGRLAREPGLRAAVRARIVADYGVAAMVGRTEALLLPLVGCGS